MAHGATRCWPVRADGAFWRSCRLRSIIEACQAHGVGVLLDWVPAHFPSDAHGLARFDGTACTSTPTRARVCTRTGNTLIYNYGRNEVRNLLVANALYWLERFGVDGLRVDAVASMLYRDYSRAAGEWIPNRNGGRENLEAIDFLQRMNEIVGREVPGTITVAEESTACPASRGPPAAAASVFTTSGTWLMHDTADVLRQGAGASPLAPQHAHVQPDLRIQRELRAAAVARRGWCMARAHCSARCPATAGNKFANLRLLFSYMWLHPGKNCCHGLRVCPGARVESRCLARLHLLDDPAHRGCMHWCAN